MRREYKLVCLNWCCQLLPCFDGELKKHFHYGVALRCFVALRCSALQRVAARCRYSKNTNF